MCSYVVSMTGGDVPIISSGCSLSVRMLSVIVGEFHSTDGFVPGFRVQGTINSNIGFDFLIEVLHHSIALWSVSCHKFQFNS